MDFDVNIVSTLISIARPTKKSQILQRHKLKILMKLENVESHEANN